MFDPSARVCAGIIYFAFGFRRFSDVSLINRSIWYVWYGTADGHEDPVPPGMVKTLSWDTISTGAGFLLSATRG